MKIAIYSENKHPRLVYTCDFIFRCVLGLDFIILTDWDDFSSSKGMKIDYSDSKVNENGYRIHKHPSLLSENDIRTFETRLVMNTVVNLPFLNIEGHSDDFFANIFFMISRYEEYWDFKADEHGRFTADDAILNPVHPYVDIWIDLLRIELNKKFNHLPPIPKPAYQFTATYDIDHVRAYLWKGIPRSIGGLIGDITKMDLSNLKRRLATWFLQRKDPYDTFGYLDQLHQTTDINAKFFWLLGDYGKEDKNPDYRHHEFREQIISISKKYEVGIHPSYASFGNKSQLGTEINRLIDIYPDLKASRFHFLRFQLPVSYRDLIQLGIKEDYSMGYASLPGFRAGTSHPFKWYDLGKEELTELVIHPFQIMDVTLKDYMKLSIEEAEIKIMDMISCVKAYGGCLNTLWHNSSFDQKDWKGWDKLYERILHYAQDGVMPKS